jgi:glycosyltransferase involved in cell wall biosynthesis
MEAENISEVLQRVRNVLPEAHVLVVDDGSTDGTADLARAMGEELHNIEVLERKGKQGLGSAYRAGFAWGMARGHEVLVEMDSDLSHDPADLPRLVGGAAHADLTIGSRYVPGGSIPDWTLHRRLLSEWGNRYVSWMLRLGVADATAGFRAYRSSILQAFDLDAVKAEGYTFQIEMTRKVRQAGGVVEEIPIAFVDRVRGTSKMSTAIVVEALLLVTRWGIADRVRRR